MDFQLYIVREWKTAELLDRLQNGANRGKGGAVVHSACGRIGLGIACKEETSRMKNDSVKSSGRKKIMFGLRKTVYFQKSFFNNNSSSNDVDGSNNNINIVSTCTWGNIKSQLFLCLTTTQ
jgi:hypothetical protein